MLARIVLSVVVGILVAVVFFVVGTLLLPLAPVVAGLLINFSYGAGIIGAIIFFFSGREKLL